MNSPQSQDGAGDIKGTILIVDDNPINLKFMSSLLIDEGYRVQSAVAGDPAIEAASTHPPDLVLLDVRMPDMDGFEVCNRLKADMRTRDIPVIFLSGAVDVQSRICGLKAGAVDYITKPFDNEEILARVETHLTIQRLQRQLKIKNQELADAVHQREEVESIIRHDIKGPLLPIINFPNLVKKNPALTEKQLLYLEKIESAGLRILQMIEKSEILLKMENSHYPFPIRKIDLIKILNEVLDGMQNEINRRAVDVRVLLDNGTVKDQDGFMLWGEESLCTTMLENLIINAVEASAPGETVTIRLEVLQPPRLSIHNNAAVPETIRARFFEKYVTAGKRKGTGIGTYSARLAIERLGGDIQMTSSETDGTTVYVQFAMTPDDTDASAQPD
jgi:two-component system, sensor histidine kinase and response regulator